MTDERSVSAAAMAGLPQYKNALATLGTVPPENEAAAAGLGGKGPKRAPKFYEFL